MVHTEKIEDVVVLSTWIRSTFEKSYEENINAGYTLVGDVKIHESDEGTVFSAIFVKRESIVPPTPAI